MARRKPPIFFANPCWLCWTRRPPNFLDKGRSHSWRKQFRFWRMPAARRRATRRETSFRFGNSLGCSYSRRRSRVAAARRRLQKMSPCYALERVARSRPTPPGAQAHPQFRDMRRHSFRMVFSQAAHYISFTRRASRHFPQTTRPISPVICPIMITTGKIALCVTLFIIGVSLIEACVLTRDSATAPRPSTGTKCGFRWPTSPVASCSRCCRFRSRRRCSRSPGITGSLP